MPTTDRNANDPYETQEDRTRLESTKDKVFSALDASREKAGDAARRTAESIEGNPLGILVGGLAVGAIAGALLPRSDKEKELLAPLGRQLTDRAKAAVSAAKETGRSELADLGISRDAARSQAKGLLQGVSKALSHAGGAAVKGATDTPSA